MHERLRVLALGHHRAIAGLPADHVGVAATPATSCERDLVSRRRDQGSAASNARQPSSVSSISATGSAAPTPGGRFTFTIATMVVAEYARDQGYLELFARAGVEVISPGCGACIGCGPGVSDRGDQVSVSAINRNYKGRRGPGQLYLASPLTVAASAIAGEIVEYREG